MGNYVHAAAGIEPAGDRRLLARVHLAPGEPLSGPTHRPGGDPGDRFDSFASRCVDEGRYLDVLRAHQAIQAYLGQNPGAAFAATAAGTRPCRAAQLADAAGLALAARHLHRADAL